MLLEPGDVLVAIHANDNDVRLREIRMTYLAQVSPTLLSELLRSGLLEIHLERRIRSCRQLAERRCSRACRRTSFAQHTVRRRPFQVRRTPV